MRLRTCEICRLPFPVDASNDWYRSCTPCYKKFRKWDLNPSDDAFIKMQRIYVAELKQQKRMEPPSKVEHPMSLTPERIREIISLCHPDKHKGSERANEVTKWLLSLREKVKK